MRGYSPEEKEVIASRLMAWCLAASEAHQSARRDLMLDPSGRPIGLRRSPGYDPMEALDAAHECEHGYLPHDSFVGCSCWQRHGRASDLNHTERAPSRRSIERAA